MRPTIAQLFTAMADGECGPRASVLTLPGAYRALGWHAVVPSSQCPRFAGVSVLAAAFVCRLAVRCWRSSWWDPVVALLCVWLQAAFSARIFSSAKRTGGKEGEGARDSWAQGGVVGSRSLEAQPGRLGCWSPRTVCSVLRAVIAAKPRHRRTFEREVFGWGLLRTSG